MRWHWESPLAFLNLEFMPNWRGCTRWSLRSLLTLKCGISEFWHLLLISSFSRPLLGLIGRPCKVSWDQQELLSNYARTRDALWDDSRYTRMCGHSYLIFFLDWASGFGLSLVVAEGRLFGMCDQGSDLRFHRGHVHGFLEQLTHATIMRMAHPGPSCSKWEICAQSWYSLPCLPCWVHTPAPACRCPMMSQWRKHIPLGSGAQLCAIMMKTWP